MINHAIPYTTPTNSTDRIGQIYYASGLTTFSEIPLPELVPAIPLGAYHDENAQIQVRIAVVPEKLPNACTVAGNCQISDTSFLMDVPKVARYLVTGGNNINIEPFPGADSRDIRLFLLGTAFGMLLHQRGVLPMHASAVALDNGCVLFTGQSGAGKSTIAAFLKEKGYSVLTDDICAITFNKQGQPLAWPGFPRLKLWTDALAELHHDPNELVREHIRTEKFHMKLDRTDFSNMPMLVTHIYDLHELDSDADNKRQTGVRTELMSPHAAMSALLSNTYRSEILTSRTLRFQNFKQCAELAGAVKVLKLSRSKDFGVMDEVLTHLNNQWILQ